MKKHLFLEGLVQTGKSTLIRECIAPYIEQVGGFSSQRILDEHQRACGYRLVPASNLELETPLSSKASGIFKIHGPSGTEKDLTVFEKLGVELLATPGRLMLLDEIGGAELLVPAFRKKLYQVLDGNIPCIGVLKLNESAAFMRQAAGYPGKVVDANQALRSDLVNRFDASIVYYEEHGRDMIKEEIKTFLEHIF